MTTPVSAESPGITRAVIIELCQKLGLPISEPNMTRYELFTADEIFLTGTGAELLPVVKLDGRVIGNGKFGPVTLKLLEAYRKLTSEEGTPFLPGKAGRRSKAG